jgi:hypothetical protein
MLLDNRTFGYTEFDITDNDLFQEAVAGPNGKRKLGFINISSPNAGRNNLMVYNEVCMDFYICGDPNGEYTCYNGCDYLNCAAAVGQPYHCYSYSFCEGWWEETGGGEQELVLVVQVAHLVAVGAQAVQNRQNTPELLHRIM